MEKSAIHPPSQTHHRTAQRQHRYPRQGIDIDIALSQGEQLLHPVCVRGAGWHAEGWTQGSEASAVFDSARMLSAHGISGILSRCRRLIRVRGVTWLICIRGFGNTVKSSGDHCHCERAVMGQINERMSQRLSHGTLSVSHRIDVSSLRSSFFVTMNCKTRQNITETSFNDFLLLSFL